MLKVHATSKLYSDADFIVGAYASRARKALTWRMICRDSANGCVRVEDLPLACEVMDLRIIPKLDLTIQLVRRYHLVYRRASINDSSERVEVIKEGSRVVYDEMCVRDGVFVGSKMSFSTHDKMWKYISKIGIYLAS